MTIVEKHQFQRDNMVVMARQIHAFNRALGRLLMVITLLMALVHGASLAFRELLGFPAVFLPELVWTLCAIMLLAGAGFAQGARTPIRMDIAYRRLSHKGQQRVDRFTNLALVLPFCFMVGLLSTPYILRSWQSLEGSIDFGGLPGLFLVKTLLWVFALLLGLQCIAELILSRVKQPQE